MTLNRWHWIFGCLGTLFILLIGQELRLNRFDDKFNSQSFVNERLRESLDSFHYEFADDCSWIELDKDHLLALGIPLHRKSDNRPVEVSRVYACQNYKDYPE